MDRLLNVPEVAALLGVSRPTIYRLVQLEGLPSIRLAERTLRFRVQDIEKWLEARAR